MIVIVGLGNTPKEYANTRHNVGFRVLDELAKQIAAKPKWQGKDHRAELMGRLNGEPVLLIKPQEFMNSSGQGVRAAVDFYRVSMKDIWVVFDDVNVDLGFIRVRESGSSGGHKGVESIINHLRGGEFPRVRVGVGPLPAKTEPNSEVQVADKLLTDFVLSRFSKGDRKVINKVVEAASRLITEALPGKTLKEQTVRV